MRVTRIVFFSLGCLLLGQAAHAGAPRFKMERDQSGRLQAISMHGQVSVRAGGQIVLHPTGTPATLRSLGATQYISARAIAGNSFAVQAHVASGSPLARMIKIMSKRTPASADPGPAGAATEKLRVGGARWEGGAVDAEITVLTGAAALGQNYVDKVLKVKKFAPDAPSYQAWANTPIR